MLLLAASLLFTNPMPLEMPRASGYLVREGKRLWLEDRFNRSDLWLSRTVDGRWVDDEDRVFLLAHLEVLPPMESVEESTVTRENYLKSVTAIDKREKKAVRTAIAALSPVALPEKEMRPHQLPRGFKDVDYWQGTNTSVIVCAYLPEKSSVWGLAIWQLAENDDFDECLKSFEKEFFDSSNIHLTRIFSDSDKSSRSSPLLERELLRADARHAIAAYENWHATDANEFSILDDLKDRSFITSITNDLPIMRSAFAATVPTKIDTTNTLAVARIFADRAEYLEALTVDGLTNMTWSAAYWSPMRRELVAYVDPSSSPLISTSPSDLNHFFRTFRHESFHQYLSYATSMISASPWLNEGYAQYFEEGPEGPRFVDPADLVSLADFVPTILMMDYGEFYDGTDFERQLKYRLALTIVYFLEKGAPKVRFQPFKDVKTDYFTALFETKDMRKATAAAFKDADTLKKFVSEWTKFWKEQ